MAERITVKRAAELTGMSELSVRHGIKKGTLPIGSAINRCETRTMFHISPHLLAQYLGMSIEEVKGIEKNEQSKQGKQDVSYQNDKGID